jgi:peptide/nickel transport system substrate-binding protein
MVAANPVPQPPGEAAQIQPAPVDGGVFRRALPAEPATLNPVIAADVPSYFVYKYIFDPLLDMDADKKLVGVLVQSWTVSKDSKTVTLNLRKNVLWHDGKPFTADDVIFTFQAIKDDAVESQGKRAMFDRIASFKKVDPYTIVITWKEAYAPGLSDLVLYIVPKHIYGYIAGKGDAFNRNPRNAEPVGTGPYRFVEWRRGQYLTLQANDRYFRGRPHLDKLVFKIIPQAETEFAAFQTGELDLTRLTPDRFDKTKGDQAFNKKARILEYPTRQYFYIAWNQDGSNPFFKDVNVRRALALAMNRQGIVEKALHGHALLSSGPFLPGSWEADPSVKPLPYDPRQAAKLLDEAGWKEANGDGLRKKDGVPLEFECLCPQESLEMQRFLEFFQQDLQKVGVSMKIRPLEWSVFMGRTRRHQYQAFLLGYSVPDDPSPYGQFHSSQAAILQSAGEAVGENDFSYKNPAVDALLEEQQRALDPKARQQLLWRIHQALASDQPACFLFVPTSLAAISSKYQGVKVSPAGYGLFSWYPAVLDWWIPKDQQ